MDDLDCFAFCIMFLIKLKLDVRAGTAGTPTVGTLLVSSGFLEEGSLIRRVVGRLVGRISGAGGASQ